MDPNMATEIDPLSMYEYPSFSYHHLHYTYPYDVKLEQPPTYVNNNTDLNHPQNIPAANDPPQNVPQTSENDTSLANCNQSSNDTGNTDTKVETDIKPVFDLGKVKKESGKKSNYWSQKITDENFPFYACALCNVSYKLLRDLDSHLVDHKERLTSYDLRMKSKLKKKQMKKEQKKLKKLSKEVKLEVEIKPEDGYIGNEKAEDFMNNTNPVDNGNENATLSNDIINKVTEKVQEFLNNSTMNDSVNNQLLNNVNGNDPVSAVNNDKVSKAENEGTKNGETKSGEKEVEYNKDLEKIYKCSACQKQFSLSYYLKLHVRSHTDEKPYTCSECGQSFITASKLGRHNKRIHLAIKYQCRICYKIFTRFEYLTRHFDKKHAEDKLEGEPYDYNAILPYLKELEEQLREKAEEEAKPKSEALWDDWPEMEGAQFVPPAPPAPPAEDNKFDAHVMNHLDIVMDDVKNRWTLRMEVKIEVDEPEAPAAADGDPPSDNDADRDDVKDESMSDEDYFPSNTWTEPPKMEPCPSPPRGRRPKQEGPLTCKICDKSISTASYMRIHTRTHTGERPYKCYVCGRGFITSSKMHRHVLTHSETWEKDGVKVEGAQVKEEADAEAEGGEGGDKDAKKPRKKRAVKKKRDYQKRPHACEYCQKRFLHLEMLQVHKKSHEGEDAVLKCYYCLADVIDEAGLKEHEATHSGPKPFLCTLCGKGYKRRETMVYHRKNHKAEKKFICDICSKTFNAPCKLQRHLVSHRADKFVLRYECPVCAHMFNTKYHVQMHLATHQKEGLILEENRNDILAMVLQNARKIPKQGDAPTNLSDLIPADERSRVCNICGEVFQHFYYLEEHLKSHGSRIAIEDENKPEERKHVCQVCNKSFKLHYYLKLHSFTHTKEKPYICQQCGKGFITKGKLKRHLETHSGLKKYQCHICYKFFTRPSYLRIHVRTIHGNQDYNFRVGKEFGIAAPLNALSVMTQYSE
ncbi:hypothetical protein MSG28_014783 [Choristoneura fumiferana]|uniref:Uncharacterized protein n=1 Tax=Choristoneura fumiferana TaxID=7141 RepID=A0ACC0JT18_CHOFU|nr:hypothetical protein MSG28_014783 [Choristoneura fumiferana]